MRVTLRDIANRLGVSHSTVVMALRNDHTISTKRRHQVRRAAEKMGYKPDPFLSGLAAYSRSRVPAKERGVLAWINRWKAPRQLRQFREFDAYWSGASEAAKQFGYRVDEVRWSLDCSPKRLENIAITGTGSAIELGSANNLTLNGGISGSGALTFGDDGDNTSLYLAGANTMSGGSVTIAGNNNYVRFSSASAGNANANWTINSTAGRCTFDFSSGTINFGSLAGSGVIQGNVNGANSLNITISIGANNNSTTFSGIIHNNGWGTGPIGLTKVGSGILTLTGANDYNGATAVNAGSLVISTVSLAKGNYSVAANATLGFTNTASSSALVSNLTVAASSTLDFQNITSTTTPLVIASNLTINGNGTVKITGTNNLVAGNNYPLVKYSGVLNGFANLQLQMPYGWRGTLANSGNQISLANAATVADVPPLLLITNTGAQLQFSWSQTHIGWRLQVQTNALNVGLGTNWSDVSAAVSTNQITVPIDATNGSVFYRLTYP